jgi:hypothetical protein
MFDRRSRRALSTDRIEEFWKRRRVCAHGESLARPPLIEMFFRKAGRAGFVKRRALSRADAPTPEARGLRRPKAGAVVESERGTCSKAFPKARRSTLETRPDKTARRARTLGHGGRSSQVNSSERFPADGATRPAFRAARGVVQSATNVAQAEPPARPPLDSRSLIKPFHAKHVQPSGAEPKRPRAYSRAPRVRPKPTRTARTTETDSACARLIRRRFVRGT